MQEHTTITLDREPFSHFSAVNVAPGSRGIMRTQIPVYKGTTSLLPEEVDALIITSDLQMHDRKDVPVEERTLMGHIICRELAALGEVGELPPPARTGVLLAGDLYASAEMKKRGTTGDVQDVWMEFAETFRWVTGVAGNHDLFRGKDAFDLTFRKHLNAHPLHGDVIKLDGLTLGGISGIFGTPGRKPWRHNYEDFEGMLEDTLARDPDILLLHEGPVGTEDRQRGNAFINDTLAKLRADVPLIICGHSHWGYPYSHNGSGHETLNVDATVVVLTK